MTEAGKIITVGNVKGLCVCGHEPCDGLDCGVFLPGQAPRKQSTPKSPEEMADIRARAWATRRATFAANNHALERQAA